MNLRRWSLLSVCIFSFLICLILASQTRSIACWPSDSCISYIPAALQFSELSYISELHHLAADSLSKLNMHLKEVLILGIAIFQKITGDSQTLYPNIVFIIFCFFLSSIFLYLIFKNLFGATYGLLASGILLTTLWPYIYVIFGAHQILVLMNFLISFYFSEKSFSKLYYALIAGVFLALMLFSSPTSIIYLPYFLILFFHKKKSVFDKEFLKKALPLGCVGFVVIALLFVLPNPLQYLIEFRQYLQTSQYGNHFGLLERESPELLSETGFFRGEGFLWIIRYLFLISPILLFGYIVSIVYLLRKDLIHYRLILLSCSSLILVEMSQVAQIGRNYFSFLFGVIYLIVQASMIYFSLDKQSALRKFFTGIFIILFLCHAGYSYRLFSSDVFPTRMAVTKLHQWLEKEKVDTIIIPENHPNTLFTINMLQSIKDASELTIYSAKDLESLKRGVVVIPPLNGETIWHNCLKVPYSDEKMLREFIRKAWNGGKVVNQIPTVGSSRIWAQEEEVCAYKSLSIDMLNTTQKENQITIIQVR